MKMYIINENTVALLKKNNKTVIYDCDKIINIDKNIKKILEYNCNYYGSSFEGRKKSAQKILNLKYKVPILIEENKNLVLIQINSIRNEECLFLVTNKIIDYKKIDNNLKIFCCNNINFYINISKNSFEKLLINSIKINNLLKWRKNVNFL